MYLLIYTFAYIYIYYQCSVTPCRWSRWIKTCESYVKLCAEI